MTKKDAWAWKFNGALEDDSSVLCSECKEWSPLADWTETDVFCETCGEHTAMQCPRCKYAFDHVWSEPFDIKKL